MIQIEYFGNLNKLFINSETTRLCWNITKRCSPGDAFMYSRPLQKQKMENKCGKSPINLSKTFLLEYWNQPNLLQSRKTTMNPLKLHCNKRPDLQNLKKQSTMSVCSTPVGKRQTRSNLELSLVWLFKECKTLSSGWCYLLFEHPRIGMSFSKVLQSCSPDPGKPPDQKKWLLKRGARLWEVKNVVFV